MHYFSQNTLHYLHYFEYLSIRNFAIENTDCLIEKWDTQQKGVFQLVISIHSFLLFNLLVKTVFWLRNMQNECIAYMTMFIYRDDCKEDLTQVLLYKWIYFKTIFGKRDQMWGWPSILSPFRNEFNKSNITQAWMLDSVYLMTSTERSGSVVTALDLGSYGHCVVSLSKTLYRCLVLVQSRRTRPDMTTKLLSGT